MLRLRLTFRRFFSPIIGLSLVLVMAGTTAVAFAQQPAPQVTSVTVTTVTNTSAAINFSTNTDAGAKILFGTTTAYGSSNPAIGYTTPARVNHVIPLDNLTPSTTYHFQIEVNNSAGTSKSADRTFTTKSGTSTTGPLVLNNVIADCVDTRCQILFTPNRAVNVKVVWDSAPHSSFDAYPAANVVQDQPVGLFSDLRRALAIPSTGALQAGTLYYYRLYAVDDPNPANANTLNTNDLQFRTSTNANDHTFSTGGCTLPDGTTIPIGSCGAGGYYCPSGGGPPVQDCTKSCGFICPSDSTCRTNGTCEGDPALNGSPFQCNKTTGGPSACYDDNGIPKNPAPAGCYSTWGKCNANTILQVRKDRGCNLWLTCATSVQTEPKAGAPAENLCLTLAACNSLNQQGQCNSYLPQGQCANDPLRFCATNDDCAAGGSCNLPSDNQPTQSLKDLTYTTPNEVKQIANLSGNVMAGLDWNTIGGATVIQGNLPWQLMRQVGGDGQITNGDFEYSPPNPYPWVLVPATVPAKNMKIEFEDQSNSTNHVLRVALITSALKTEGTCSNAPTTACATDAACPAGGICRIGVCTNNAAKTCSVDSTCTAPGTCDRVAPVTFAGVASKDFTADPGEFYFAEARVRAEAGTPRIRIQFGHSNNRLFTVPDGPDAGPAPDPTYIDIVAKGAWQRVTLGPIVGMSGSTRVGIVCADPTTCEGAEIMIDDVQVKPVLQVNTNPAYVTPSCRLYPKADSPACDYFDQNGVLYKGWKGYCLENDSVTGTCLSWWPVDILQGESSLFGTNTRTGYDDRAPLYLCAEAIGNNKGGPFDSQSYVMSNAYDFNTSACNPAGNACVNDGQFNASHTIGACGSTNPLTGSITAGQCTVTPPATANERQLTETQITKIDWTLSAGESSRSPSFSFTNDDRFRTSSASNPYFPTLADIQANPYADCPDGNPADGRRVCYRIYRDAPANSTKIFWRYENTACAGYGLNQNCVSASIAFDAATGKFLEYSVTSDDRTASSMEGAFYQVKFQTKEFCSKLVEVVKPEGVNQAYATRVKSPSYTVPNLNYQQSTDLAPFGGALGPDTGNTPLTWPFLSIEQQNTQVSTPGQARGGRPYACNGPCDKFVCSNNHGLTCLNADGSVNNLAVRQCEDDYDGICIGGGNISVASNIGPQSFDTTHNPTAVDPVANKAFFAQERIRRVFTQAYSLWTWTGLGYSKELNADGSNFIPWTSPSTICPLDNGVPKRPPYEPSHADYCAIPPSIIAGSAKFLTEGSNIATITGGSGSVGIKFNTEADPEQVPLQGFSISWGDTNSYDSYAFPYAPKNDPANPHIFAKVYRNTGPTCTGGNRINCCTVDKTCEYQIRIQVKDNWGWCNNAVSGNKCPSAVSTWSDTGLTVRVQP